MNKWGKYNRIIRELDFTGGGAYSANPNGLHKIIYIAREPRYKIIYINIKLYLMWKLSK